MKKEDILSYLEKFVKPITAADLYILIPQYSHSKNYVRMQHLFRLGYLSRFKEDLFYYQLTKKGIDVLNKKEVIKSVKKEESERVKHWDMVKMLSVEELRARGYSFKGGLIVDDNLQQALSERDIERCGTSFRVVNIKGDKLFYEANSQVSFVWRWAVELDRSCGYIDDVGWFVFKSIGCGIDTLSGIREADKTITRSVAGYRAKDLKNAGLIYREGRHRCLLTDKGLSLYNSMKAEKKSDTAPLKNEIKAADTPAEVKKESLFISYLSNINDVIEVHAIINGLEMKVKGSKELVKKQIPQISSLV